MEEKIANECKYCILGGLFLHIIFTIVHGFYNLQRLLSLYGECFFPKTNLNEQKIGRCLRAFIYAKFFFSQNHQHYLPEKYDYSFS